MARPLLNDPAGPSPVVAARARTRDLWEGRNRCSPDRTKRSWGSAGSRGTCSQRVELIAATGSAGVFREAVRLLEHHGLAGCAGGCTAACSIGSPTGPRWPSAMAVLPGLREGRAAPAEDAPWLPSSCSAPSAWPARISGTRWRRDPGYLAVEATKASSGDSQSLYDFHVLCPADRQPGPAPVRPDAHRPDPPAAAPRADPLSGRRPCTRPTSRSPSDHRPATARGPAPDDDPPGRGVRDREPRPPARPSRANDAAVRSAPPDKAEPKHPVTAGTFSIKPGR